jgi:hypothetical protein
MSDRKAIRGFDLVTGSSGEVSCGGPHAHMMQQFCVNHLLGLSLLVALSVFLLKH